MTAAALAFRTSGRTDIGRVRSRNEDAILLRDHIGLWLVADGLGGHSAGEFASQMLVDRLQQRDAPGDPDRWVDVLDDLLQAVNRDLRAAARERGVGYICSTVALLVDCGAYLLCGWVGDSRIYHFSEGRLHRTTRDHALGSDEDLSVLSAEVRPQPGGGVLTRAVGAEDQLHVDWAVVARRDGMRFLLCSDGVNKEISDREIEAMLQSTASPDAVVERLVETALARGGRDNISAIVVDAAG